MERGQALAVRCGSGRLTWNVMERRKRLYAYSHGTACGFISATVEKRVGGRSVFVLCGEEKNTATLFEKSVCVGYLT